MHDNSFYDQLVFVILNELDGCDIAVVETTGLAIESISHLVKFCHDFLLVNRDKLIVLIQREHERVKYPECLLVEISNLEIKDTLGWLKELDLKYLK